MSIFNYFRNIVGFIGKVCKSSGCCLLLCFYIDISCFIDFFYHIVLIDLAFGDRGRFNAVFFRHAAVWRRIK